MSVDWGESETVVRAQNDAIGPKWTLVGYVHSRPNWAALIMSGLPPVATVGADIPARQLRAINCEPHRATSARRRMHFALMDYSQAIRDDAAGPCVIVAVVALQPIAASGRNNSRQRQVSPTAKCRLPLTARG